ncbi:thiopurine S-methyltransferase [Desulfuromonas versatilis]|uniref:Thiopurine S-methyltransferase n=1 Tax=Desulfuromonas versatilis TaxID=2802975 RepID=A0ABN6E1K3_9BACT|nr:thiopurine S-methyltransferase [Desulfuromonas versatilis]BCR06212.1 thiopurine S-methyltransferase [Desulfuromonas versatilis]
MDKQFWINRWEKNELGWHMTSEHPYLRRFFSRLQTGPGERVFVPLCGKSPDLLWLARQGAGVVGVELSRQGVEAFFAENRLAVTRQEVGAELSHYRSGEIEVFCGDLFAISRDHLGGARAAYDRGSLVALPPAMRGPYAARMAELLPSGSRVLLVSYDYDQQQAAGPPFAVPIAQIRELFHPAFAVELLAEEDALPTHQGLQQRGVTKLTEFACLLIRQ